MTLDFTPDWLVQLRAEADTVPIEESTETQVDGYGLEEAGVTDVVGEEGGL